MSHTTRFADLHITPKKVRFLLPAVRKLTPTQAMDFLYYQPQKAAGILRSAIKSALTNAQSVLKVSADMVQFEALKVDEGTKLKRYQAGSRGNAKPVMRRMSHLTIVFKEKHSSTLSAAKKDATAEVDTKLDTKEEAAPKKTAKAAKPKAEAKKVPKPKAKTMKEES